MFAVTAHQVQQNESLLKKHKKGYYLAFFIDYFLLKGYTLFLILK